MSKNEGLAFFKAILSFVVVILLLREFVVEAFKIPSGSMIPTLEIGDHLLVSKISYGLRVPFRYHSAFNYLYPERGDIVVFTRPESGDIKPKEGLVGRIINLPSEVSEYLFSKDNIIKRVIGLPGDTVEVNGKTVLVNGKALEEPYCQWIMDGFPEGDFGPAIVPEGKVFLLGDNRDASKDSRFWEEDHFLEISRIKGRAIIIYWNSDDLRRIGKLVK